MSPTVPNPPSTPARERSVKMLRVSLAICTWNRAASLERTLRSMIALSVPADVQWELIIVNNACSDATDEVIASFSDKLPIRRAYERTPGLAIARNRAVAEATGEYIVWTDDDVLVDPGWLTAYCDAFRAWPGAQVFGGPIEPLFEGEPPSWLPRVLDQIGWVYGRQSFGQEPVRLSPDNIDGGPYGANMAFRMDVLRKRGFDSRLGVRHEEYATGEETELIRETLLAGGEGWWIPMTPVMHLIPRSNQTTRYIRRWMVGRARAASIARGDNVPLSRIPRIWLRIAWHELAFQTLRLVGPPETWIQPLLRTSYARGRLMAARVDLPRGEQRA